MILEAPFLENTDSRSDISSVSDLLNGLTQQPLAISPWKGYEAPVTVTFALAHGLDCIALKYFVKEPFSKPVYDKANDPVYKDSCVEFFIGFNNEAEYYNFEFNNAGTCLLGFGSGKERTMVSETLIQQIKYSRSFKNAGGDLISWELSLIIPFQVFPFHHITKLGTMPCRGNFFKCGDDLPKPHYLVWSNISSGTPDFHQPAFFGTIDFG